MPNNTTLLDLAKLNGADPVVGLIEEVATSSPEVVTIPARTIRGTSYKTVVRNSRPSVAFRSANEGTAGTKSNFAERLVEAELDGLKDAVARLEPVRSDIVAPLGRELIEGRRGERDRLVGPLVG